MKKQFKDLLRKCFLSGLFLILMGIQYSYAQQTVSGTVTDENNQPVPGTNIIVKGTTTGTQTDFDGNYSISALSTDILIFSYLGYATENITIGNKSTINVKLTQDASQLEEVVVIGYGTSKKSDLTGAVSQVSSKSFEKQPLTRVEDALQGRAAGVSVASGGSPGSGIKVRIRGVNSITGNNAPLVVVDGIIGGDLATINPNDIASMDVLKDASALAIYGSRGSNGVILVTTKKGSGKPKVSIDHFTSFSELRSNISTISSSEFANIKNEEAIAGGGTAPFSSNDLANLQANPIDYEDELFQNAISNNTQISVSGGDDKIRYFVSGNYTDQEGIVITTKYERYSLRANLDAKINEKLSLGINMYGSRETQVNNPDDFNRFKGSSILRALTWDPTTPVRDENGNFNLLSTNANNGFNPIAALVRSKRERVADRLNAAINIGYKFTNNFNYKLILGVTTLNQNLESFIFDGDQSIEGSAFNRINFGNVKNTTHQVSNILNWKKNFGKHDLDLTGVYEFQGFKGTSNNNSTNGVNAPNFYTSDNSDITREGFTNSGGVTAIESYLGRAQYNYNNSLYITASMRVDESSKFSKGNRTGYFPSAALAYSFGKMNFIEDGEILTALKFRAGWGKVGNENINSTARLAVPNLSGGYAYDGVSAVPAEFEAQQANEGLTWETTTQTNIGLDLGFFNGRLNTSIDYYKKTTDDLLLLTTIPGTSYTQFQNAGVVDNSGIDFTLSGNVISNDNFTWDSTFTLSQINNEVTELNDDQEIIFGNILSIDGSGNSLNVIEKGQPLGQLYGLTYLGTWKSTDDIPLNDAGTAPIAEPGDAKYLRDENGANVLGAIGNGLPTLTWGLNNTFTYKKWDLNVLVNASHGFDVYNQVKAAINGGTSDYRDNLNPSAIANAWTPTNETDVIRKGATNNTFSSRYIEDGSFIRLSNLRLGYTATDLFKGIENLQIYVSGQNLFLISDYDGYDPEVSSTPVNTATRQSTVDVGPGIDFGAYPNPRVYTLGVKIGF